MFHVRNLFDDESCSSTNDWIRDGLGILIGVRQCQLGIGSSFGSFLEPFHALALEDIRHVPRRLSSGLMPGEVRCLWPGMKIGLAWAVKKYGNRTECIQYVHAWNFLACNSSTEGGTATMGELMAFWRFWCVSSKLCFSFRFPVSFSTTQYSCWPS